MICNGFFIVIDFAPAYVRGSDADIPLSDVKTSFPVALTCASLGTFSIQQLALPLMWYTATCSVQLAEKII